MSEEKLTKKICDKCGKEKKIIDFFKYRTGEYCELCKTCLTLHVDNTDPTTFLWILEKFNVPYIESQWVSICNNQIQKRGKLGPLSVLGLYLRTMGMAQFKDYTYKDSDALNFAEEKRLKEAEERRQKKAMDKVLISDLRERLERGEISQAEFDTLNPENYEETEMIEPPEKIKYINPITIDENDIAERLTREDMQMLALKWGTNYKPSEWVRMEEIYNRYANEYELNTDRELTLKSICKTHLKLDQALDMEDVANADKLSRMLDQLRKSGKFTEAQKQEEQVRYLDSIGELVLFCEREGGIIEQIKEFEEYPQDKIDITIRDLQAYTRNLAINELGLGDLIESYIKKLEASEAAKETEEDLEAGLITSKEEEIEYLEKEGMQEEDFIDFQAYVESELQADENMILEAMESMV